MIPALPIFRRELRAAFVSPWLWVLACWLLSSSFGGRPHVHSGIYLVAFVTAYAAWRAVVAERERETLDLVAATPTPAASVLLQIGIAWSVAGLLVALAPATIQSYRWPCRVLEPWLKGLAMAAVLGPLGALGPLRYGAGGRQALGGLLLGGLCLTGLGLGLLTLWRAPAAWAVPGILACGAAGWWVLWRVFVLVDGDWPGALHAQGAGARRGPHPLSRLRVCVPDRFPPVLFRELSTNAPTLIVCGVLVPATLLALQWAMGPLPLGDEMLIMSLAIGMPVGAVAVALLAATRVAADRREAVWEHLRSLPLSTPGLAAAYALGALVVWLGMVGPIGLAALGPALWSCTDLGPMDHASLACLLAVNLMTWVPAALCGVVAGCLASSERTAGPAALLILASLFVVAFGGCSVLLEASDTQTIRGMHVGPWHGVLAFLVMPAVMAAVLSLVLFRIAVTLAHRH